MSGRTPYFVARVGLAPFLGAFSRSSAAQAPEERSVFAVASPHIIDTSFERDCEGELKTTQTKLPRGYAIDRAGISRDELQAGNQGLPRLSCWPLLLMLMSSPLAGAGCASASARSNGEIVDRPRIEGNVVHFSEAFAHRIGLETTEVRAGKVPLEISGMGTVSLANEGPQVSTGTAPHLASPSGRVARWGELFLQTSTAMLVHPGDAAEVSGATESASTLKARVTEVRQPVGEQPSRASVQIRIEDAEGLRLGQSIRVVIHASAGTSAPGYIVPTEAVTFVAGEPSVFLLEAPGMARIVSIEPWYDSGHGFQLKGELQVDARVVTTGLFELKSELFR